MKTRLLTTLTAMIIALSAWANGTEIDGIYYLLDSKTKTAGVTYTGMLYDENPISTAYKGSITIPASVIYRGTTYSVTTIGKDAFYGCTSLTSIDIPNSVTSIGYAAFWRCTGLTSIDIPNSVTSIGHEAFGRCTGLMNIILGNSVTSIEGSAFVSCTNLTSITIPKSVTSIGDWAFAGCTGLTSITIPESVTTIGNWAFDGCTGLTSIKVEAGNTEYDSRDNCNAIIETASNTLVVGCKATIIPSSVTCIGGYAFRGCTGLTSITIPNSVTSIGYAAFEGCTGLTSITIPSSFTYIGDHAFYGCTGLTSITIPNSVTGIGVSAFWGCTGLTSIAIPSSVTSIGKRAFSGCTGLTSVNIPNSVTSIGDYGFSNCTGLTSVNIPNSVISIGIYALEGCTSMTSINIPNSVTSIGESAFKDCSSLRSIKVETGNTTYDSRDNCNAIIETASNTLITGCQTTTIPNSVKSINRAFRGCSTLTSITIPNTVTYIGNYTFDGCTGLKDIIVQHTNPENCFCNIDAFDKFSYKTATLHVPVGCVAVYYNCRVGWSLFDNITDNVTGIDHVVINAEEQTDSAPTIVGYYNLQGQRIAEPQRGQLVIVRYSDGSSRKMYVR